MAFGVNMAQVLGRLGDDVAINHLASGGRVANMSIATDESYIDINSQWQRVKIVRRNIRVISGH